MSTRWLRFVRCAALACLVPASGCCTWRLWDAAPIVRPERLVGARVDVRGELELGVEMTNGERRSYRQDGTDVSDYLTLQMAPAPERDASAYPWPCTPDRLPDTGALRWEHPGTWTCVVATPVSAAVDLVTLPIQFVVLLVKWPRC